jgi:hypothetical protein
MTFPRCGARRPSTGWTRGGEARGRPRVRELRRRRWGWYVGDHTTGWGWVGMTLSSLLLNALLVGCGALMIRLAHQGDR